MTEEKLKELAAVVAFTRYQFEQAMARLREYLNRQYADNPKIICLCGSTRFIEHFAIMAWELEKQGAIVLGLHYLPAWYMNTPDHGAEFEGVAEHFDNLHLRKIDLADEVFVLNVGGYIGESTSKEIQYAQDNGKIVRYLE